MRTSSQHLEGPLEYVRMHVEVTGWVGEAADDAERGRLSELADSYRDLEARHLSELILLDRTPGVQITLSRTGRSPGSVGASEPTRRDGKRKKLTSAS